MTTSRRSLPEAVTVGSYIIARANQLHISRADLAKAVGVVDSMVYHWQHGAALPSITTAERLAEVLKDQRILNMVRDARVRRCAYAPCDRSFTRRPGSHRLYCSTTCKDWAHKNPDAKRDRRQAAIDQMCEQCEPTDKLCRTPECPLRAFSPFVFVPLHEVRGAA